MEIREAVSSDLESIVEVFRKCWTISYEAILPNSVRSEMSAAAAREMWRAAVEPHVDRTTLVVIDEAKVVGMARVGVDEADKSRGHLFSLYISPDSAGKGLGRKLLQAALAELHTRGFATITLWVFKENLPARALYESENFSPTGKEKIDPRWQIPQIEMATTT